ncbi:MAG: hypothetical protein ABIH65_01955 [Nanoarchaeota archaeon]
MGGGTGTGGEVSVIGSGGEDLSGRNSKELKAYCSWNISTSRYFGEEIKNGLVKILEKAGMKRKFLIRTKFKGESVEVNLEYDMGVRGGMEVKLYAGKIKEGERMRQIIQQQIDADYQKHYILSVRYDFLLNHQQ